jgi:hypothetical protein
MRYYAGIGARKTPDSTLKLMTKIAIALDNRGYVLRSGGAKGADQAFERGSDSQVIYIANHAEGDIAAHEMAKEYHGAWDKLTNKYIRNLHARNCYQVLGKDLKTPVEFVVCWTPDGCEHHKDRTITTGGTGTAISIASMHGIRVYNLYNYKSLEELRELYKTL